MMGVVKIKRFDWCRANSCTTKVFCIEFPQTHLFFRVGRRETNSVSAIKKRLEEESIYVSVQALYNLLRKYRRYSTYVDLPRRKMDRKITPEMLIEIDTELHCNDELTARQLQRLLTEKHPALEVSIPTIKRARRLIGWVSTRPHYCQLIREVRFDVHGI